MTSGQGTAKPGGRVVFPYQPAGVRLEDYDPGWPLRYANEVSLLRDSFGDDLVAIEHVGSTAVAGMSAKPVIDILLAVADVVDLATLVHRLEQVGYRYTPESEADDPGRRVFRKGPEDMARLRTHHLHVTGFDSPYWRRLVAFRDHLRCHPDDAAAYVELNRELAARYRDEPRRYTSGK